MVKDSLKPSIFQTHKQSAEFNTATKIPVNASEIIISA